MNSDHRVLVRRTVGPSALSFSLIQVSEEVKSVA